jgi:hypothetical protein
LPTISRTSTFYEVIPQHAPRPVGPRGEAGDGGAGCDGLSAGQTAGLSVALEISRPTDGVQFAAGEAPVLTARFHDRCGRALTLAQLGAAGLYVTGPRDAVKSTAAVKLLNATTDRTAVDRQHHYINLRKPHFADPAQNNLTEQPDGAVVYRLQPVTDELAGTYTASFSASGLDPRDQLFEGIDFQVKTATVEPYSSGPTESSSCLSCHQGTNGKVYMHHIEPSGFAVVGSPAIDAAPISSCKACHNNDGYSLNSALGKIHAVHRGSHLKNPGAAHPDWGQGADDSIKSFTNVAFPSMPGGEKDCVKCHLTDGWKAAPSRASCGSCHDAVNFDTGVVQPARSFGKPAGHACTQDSDCAAFGGNVTCDTASGLCDRHSHPLPAPDGQCTACHTATPGVGISPIPDRHEIFARTRTLGLSLTDVSVNGATGSNGSFQVGDTPSISFALKDGSSAVLDQLATATTLAATATLTGPTDDMQRVYASINLKTAGTLTFDATAGRYQYTFPSPWPASALAPLNTLPDAGLPVRANAPGSYALWFYVTRTVTDPKGGTFRDEANHLEVVRLGVDLPVKPRQVVTASACNSCHVDVQAHGGSRKNPQTCNACHTEGAQDRNVGAKGASCQTSTTCPGNAAGWEACLGVPTDGGSGTCTVVTDPTPGVTIDFPALVHNLHFARKRAGYAERHNLLMGELQYVGFNNGLSSFTEILMPLDARSCKTCHADTAEVCSATVPCGVGQACVGGKCSNVAWQKPSTRACLTCHDSTDDAAHAQLNTADTAEGRVESCEVCHGASSAFSVSDVHNITNPYVPPYHRE